MSKPDTLEETRLKKKQHLPEQNIYIYIYKILIIVYPYSTVLDVFAERGISEGSSNQ